MKEQSLFLLLALIYIWRKKGTSIKQTIGLIFAIVYLLAFA